MREDARGQVRQEEPLSVHSLGADVAGHAEAPSRWDLKARAHRRPAAEAQLGVEDPFDLFDRDLARDPEEHPRVAGPFDRAGRLDAAEGAGGPEGVDRDSRRSEQAESRFELIHDDRLGVVEVEHRAPRRERARVPVPGDLAQLEREVFHAAVERDLPSPELEGPLLGEDLRDGEFQPPAAARLLFQARRQVEAAVRKLHQHDPRAHGAHASQA